MKKIAILVLMSSLFSCSGYIKVDKGLNQHGEVPQENPVKKEQVIIDKKSNYAFWLVYTPILAGVGFLTWKTFRKEKSNDK
tara:strand:+ start:815 stop:1057 length:243 start_codon:yes stop_codon:yes gene_type:complete